MHGPKVRGASANSPKKCSFTVICWSCVWRKTEDQWVLPWHNCVLRLKNSRCEVMTLKDRDILANSIVVYARLTYLKPYQNTLELFWTNLNMWRSLANEPIIFTYDEKARHLIHQYSTIADLTNVISVTGGTFWFSL